MRKVMMKMCVRGVLLVAACAGVVQLLDATVMKAEITPVQLSENTSTYAATPRVIVSQLADDDVEFTASIGEVEDAARENVVIKYSSGWSVNRAHKTDMAMIAR